MQTVCFVAFYAWTAETGDENATLVVRDRVRCCEESFLTCILPCTFISHTKLSIFFGKGRSSIYILESQPDKLMLETFS